MRPLTFWLSILLPALAVICGVCFGSFPLGVPDEWQWNRVPPTEPLWLALGPLLVTAALYLGFTWIGAQRVERSRPGGLSTWICGLFFCGFTWLWIAQEAAPDNYQLSKTVWILYFRGSSGYFSEANEQAGDLPAYLAGYERKMSAGDVLHIGTHPPGLTVAFRGLLGLCREYPPLVDFALATQPESVRSAFDALNSTRFRPQLLTNVERAVLWLAALTVHLGAALTIVPLFGLLRRTCSRRASWLAVAFWPSLPALALFLPKADCLYPLLATSFLWLWLTALAHQSRSLAVLAGLALWVCLTLTLAFLPIALIALLAGYWTIARSRQRPQFATEISIRTSPDSRPTIGQELSENIRRLLPAIGCGSVGFAVPCLASWWFLKLNLLTVWWLNLQNHAGFYQQFPRTYWKWLLVNPVEWTVAAGVPLSVLAIWSILKQCRQPDGYSADARLPGYVWAWLLTLGLLWLSGKNMGEAARLWIIFMPFLVWSAGLLFQQAAPVRVVGNRGIDSPETAPCAMPPADSLLSGNGWIFALAVQFITTAVIVTQVAGFQHPITRT